MNPQTLNTRTPFLQNVDIELYAQLFLQSNGEPTYEVITVNDKEFRHYTIQLHMKTSRMHEVQMVEYFINHPDYYDDPLSFTKDREHDFRVYIMSYGDVWVEVKAYLGGWGYTHRAKLSQMLEVGHADHPSESILDAIARIKAN